MYNKEYALSLCPGLLGEAWLHEQALKPARDVHPLDERLWLLLPEKLEIPDPAQRSLQVMRREG